MATGRDWSRVEVEACVADYLRMLTLELNGQRYNKTEHANALLPKLDDRSRASLEFKHANISAVLLDLGYPYINGYKPRSNYQALLFDVVEAQAPINSRLQDAAQASVLRPAMEILLTDTSQTWVPAPRPVRRVNETSATYLPRFSPARRDYLAQETRNRSLGRAGELFVMALEARRLHEAGKKMLSERIEHVAATQGDGLGFDVLSFDENGRERFIEVKTTAFGPLTPFHVSRNELARSEADADQYHLYRLFDFRNTPKVFDLPGTITQQCRLEPITYLVRID